MRITVTPRTFAFLLMIGVSLGLTGCGSSSHYKVGGTLTGLATGQQVVLRNNGGDALTLTANGAFNFATLVASGGNYSVTVATQPSGQTCSATGANGMTSTNVTSVVVTCTSNSYTVGGSLTGLASGQQVILKNNGGDALTLTANGSFTFATPVTGGSGYAVTVGTQPTAQTCTIGGGTGSGVSANVTSVAINCVTNTFTVGGSLSGLGSGKQVILKNNGGDALTLTANGSFAFATPAASGSAYSVTVGTQPAGQTCTVAGGTGVGATNVTSVAVSCVTNTYTVGGTLSGLGSGKQLILNNNGGDALTLTANGSFTFATALNSGSNYSVTVGTQPSGQTCSVSNASGSSTLGNVTNVSVTCTSTAAFSTLTLAYSFAGPAADGSVPLASLVQASDGKFYGTTQQGGSFSNGTLFRFDPSSNTVTLIHSFGGSGDGTLPNSAIVLAKDGKYYGTTPRGGTGYGTIYQADLSMNTVTVVHSFSLSATEGQYPYGPLVLASDGFLYGTTSQGGPHNGGTVFRFDPATNTETVLYSFSVGADGSGPISGLLQASDGNLYGTTIAGGLSTTPVGVVYRIKPSTSEFIVVHTFMGGTDGETYNLGGGAALIQASDGKLYGTTSQGGSSSNPGYGTIYSIDPMTLAYTTLYRFTGAGSDGQVPFAGLTQTADGKLYGTTTTGGQGAGGTVFQFDPASNTTTVIAVFGTGSTGGSTAAANMVQGTDGRLYGTTRDGGVNRLGTVFVLQ